MVSASEKPELEKPPISLRSPVDEHFDIPVNTNNTGQGVLA